MNDALALVAISQLVCLAGLAYLYMQLQELRRDVPRRRRAGAPRMQAAGRSAATARAAREAYSPVPSFEPPATPFPRPAAAAGGLDVATLARRMNKSEEEVRLLLRRRGSVA